MPRLLIQKGEAVGRDHALGGECVVGRHPSADFVLDDHMMSRRHFRVLSDGGVWVVEDLGSTNGTLVNGQKTERQPLMDGDVIRAGGTELVFVQKDLLARSGRKAAPSKKAPAPVPRRRRRRR